MQRRFLFRGFKSPQQFLSEGLGPLERDTLDVLWRRGSCTVRDVHGAFGGTIAYTTVMTTLDRLFKKRLLVRTARGRAFVYEAAASRADLERSIAGEMVRACLAAESGVQPVLSHLVEAVSQHDRACLDELERLIREKRRALDGDKEEA
jgi:predicted transcriptional regulator